VAIAARCVGCQVPYNLGLTGEASLTGKIYPVMGLRPKLMGSAKTGTVAEPFNVLVGAGNLKGQGVHSLVERDESLPHAPQVHVKVPKASRDKLHIVGAENLFDSIELSLLKDGNGEHGAWPLPCHDLFPAPADPGLVARIRQRTCRSRCSWRASWRPRPS
jgi:hypothetical protein